MSLLNFPPEVSLQFIQKMNLFDRINLSLAHTRLSPLCFDRLLQRKSRETLTSGEGFTASGSRSIARPIRNEGYPQFQLPSLAKDVEYLTSLSLALTRSSPLCFDRVVQRETLLSTTMQRKPRETLSLNELRQLYEQSKTEIERNQCFKFNVIDRLLIKDFHGVVLLYMDPETEQFVANNRILHYLEGKIVLEPEKFSASFIEQFYCLLERQRVLYS